MNDQQTDHLALPKLRLPQVSPHQGRTTLRHFASPNTYPASPDTQAQAPAWPVPFSQIAQTQRAEVADTSATATLPQIVCPPPPEQLASGHAAARVSGSHKIVLMCIALLLVAGVVFVLAYYLTIY